MAATNSTMLELGTPAPDFALPDPSGATHRLGDLAGAKGLLVMFICNHCPFVKLLKPALADFAREYQARGLAVVAISANDAEAYPADAPDQMAAEAKQFGYPFPYLYDADQRVAAAYKAACTPDFFLFDADRKLVYRGQFDDARPGNGQPVTGADLRAAADALLAGQPISADQTPSMGCNIKWKEGHAPAYAA